MPLGLAWRPPAASARHCCDALRQALEHTCDQHATPFDCPDTMLVYNEPFDEYGMPVRDGGASYVVVTHCPWCGTRLPRSRRDDWFEEIDGLGLGDAAVEALPEKFLTADWRRPRPT